MLSGLDFVAYLQRYKHAVLAAFLRGSTQLVWSRAWLSNTGSNINMIVILLLFLNLINLVEGNKKSV